MDEDALRALLADVTDGRLSHDDAVARLRALPYTDLGFATVDHHRLVRQGLAEVVFGPGKTPTQVVEIVAELRDRSSGRPVIVTRTDDVQRAWLDDAVPGGRTVGSTVSWDPASPRPERVVVVTAGTSDLPVADECAAVLAAHGIEALRVTDVGVAGIHRILDRVDALQGADAVVVVAGMEGALASVVGGLTAAPVVAVPTSVGYGAALEGITALLGMLASCANGITVVGIDNGYGAAAAILRLVGGSPPDQASASPAGGAKLDATDGGSPGGGAELGASAR